MKTPKSPIIACRLSSSRRKMGILGREGRELLWGERTLDVDVVLTLGQGLEARMELGLAHLEACLHALYCCLVGRI